MKIISVLLSKAWVVAACVVLSVGARADSLWSKSSTPKSMLSDRRAVAVGDIVTIIVQETSTATKNNNTQTDKSSGLDASIASFLYSPDASGLLTHNGKLPAISVKSSSSFDGGGKINNSEKIVARVAVRVVDVLPNNTLVFEGRRKTAFSGETQDIILRGVVRSEDITASNTVFSYNVADATIQFISSGTLSDNQKKGWFTKVWDKITPF